MNIKPLNRRTFLKGMLGGAAVAVGLPPLEAFMNVNGTAYAESAFPLRYGSFFWGNGVQSPYWVPSEEGADWTPTLQLQPLESLKSDVTILTGMEVKLSNILAHGTGAAGIFSGSEAIVHDDENWTFSSVSIDQILAQQIGGDTRFRSVELGVEPGVKGLSFNGVNSRNAAEYSPAALFERLFGAEFRAPGDEPIIDPKLSLRRSVLDAVMGDVGRLKQKLGTGDQWRLDQHLDAVRDLELRIARIEAAPPNLAACMKPEEPQAMPDIDGRPQMSARSRAMSDLATMAYACDMTRVLSYWYSDPLSNALYPNTTAGHHQLTHDEPGDMPQVQGIILSIMEDFRYFLDNLKSIPEGDGTLLDNCLILGSSDVSSPRTHQIDEFPLVLAGKAGGRIQTGFHYRSGTKENASMIPFSVLNAMGAPVSEFGVGEGKVTQGLGVIEA